MATATPRLMGAEVKRKEDPRLVTGTSAYVGDVSVPGLQYVAFVRSPHAHARVGRIDGSRAAARPGVTRVVTGEDIRGFCQPIPLGGPDGIQVIDVPRVRHFLRPSDAAAGQEIVVPRGMLAAPVRPLSQVAQLHPENGALKAVHPRVEPANDVLVLHP